MLKMYANGEKNGQPIRIVVLGLSHGNLEELKKGRPIKFSGKDVGFKSKIELEFLIFSGETERAMMREFSQFIGPETKVHIDPRLKD
jgi:hypothetical protein